MCDGIIDQGERLQAITCATKYQCLQLAVAERDTREQVTAVAEWPLLENAGSAFAGQVLDRLEPHAHRPGFHGARHLRVIHMRAQQANSVPGEIGCQAARWVYPSVMIE